MLSHLLPEIVEIIVNFCTSSDLKNLACTSSTWREKLKPALWSTVNISFKKLKCFPYSINDPLDDFLHIETLRLCCDKEDDDEDDDDGDDDDGDDVDEIDMKRLVVNYLRVLCSCKPKEFQTCFVPEEAHIHITQLVGLEMLDLSDCVAIDEYLLGDICSSLNSLKSLDLTSTAVSDNQLKPLIQLSCLKRLHLCSCLDISDEGINHVSKVRSLKRLKIMGCSNVTDLGISYLVNLQYLKRLNIAVCHMLTDRSLEFISKLEDLRRLNLNGLTKLTDDGTAHLLSLKTLKRLKIRIKTLTDMGMTHISKLVSLKRLDVGFNYHLTDAGVFCLSSLILLKYVSLRRCRAVTDSGVLELCNNLPSLKMLDIIGCGITDNTILIITQLQSLDLMY